MYFQRLDRRDTVHGPRVRSDAWPRLRDREADRVLLLYRSLLLVSLKTGSGRGSTVVVPRGPQPAMTGAIKLITNTTKGLCFTKVLPQLS